MRQHILNSGWPNLDSRVHLSVANFLLHGSGICFLGCLLLFVVVIAASAVLFSVVNILTNVL